MSLSTLEIASKLAAARIIATGGQPLSSAAIKLCLIEAYVLEYERNEVSNGIADKERRDSLHQQLGAEYQAELKQRHLEGTLPPGHSEGTPTPRL